MALSHRPLPRLPKGERRGARESHRAIRHSQRAISARFKGALLPAQERCITFLGPPPPFFFSGTSPTNRVIFSSTQIMGIKSRTFDIPSASLANGTASAGDKSYRAKLTDKERKRVEKLIRNAKSLQEITRLEKELNDGRVPQGGGDEMEE